MSIGEVPRRPAEDAPKLEAEPDTEVDPEEDVETEKEPSSVLEDYPGIKGSKYDAGRSGSLQGKVWSSAEKEAHTIDGGVVDPRFSGRAISIEVADIEWPGSQEKKKVAVTCFADPRDGVEAGREVKDIYPAIVNHLFVLDGRYKEHDVIETMKKGLGIEE